MEAPASVDVRLADILTGVTTAVLVHGVTAITGTTVVRRALFVEPVEVISGVGAVRVGDHDSVLVEAGFQYLVGDITLEFSSDVHDVQTEDCKGEVNLVAFKFLSKRTVAWDSREGDV